VATRQELLLGQLAIKLRTDTGAGSLVTLTGHTIIKLRIARDRPPIKGDKPFLGITIVDSLPMLGPDVTHLQRSIVRFKCYAAVELTSIKLADRIEFLLHDSDPTSFYDFSGNGISNRMTRFRQRFDREHDEDTDVWNSMVDANLIWLDTSCP